MTQIEWSEPVRGAMGFIWQKKPCLEIHGSVNGEHRFTIKYRGPRLARLMDRREFVTNAAGQEIGETHVEHLKHVAEQVMEFERASA